MDDDVKPWVAAELDRREQRMRGGTRHQSPPSLKCYRPDINPMRMLDAEEIHRYEQAEMLRPRREELHNVIIWSELEVTVFSDYKDDLLAPSNVEIRIVKMSRAPAPNMRRTDRATADQWIRFAGIEAGIHAGICKPSGCTCPNCEEYQRIRTRALELYDKGYISALGEAWHMALDEMTGGMSDMRQLANTLPSPAQSPEQRVVVVTNPEPQRSWVSDRFGVLDV